MRGGEGKALEREGTLCSPVTPHCILDKGLTRPHYPVPSTLFLSSSLVQQKSQFRIVLLFLLTQHQLPRLHVSGFQYKYHLGDVAASIQRSEEMSVSVKKEVAVLPPFPSLLFLSLPLPSRPYPITFPAPLPPSLPIPSPFPSPLPLRSRHP